MVDPSAAIAAWVISPPNASTIHRFFDSSPFSPSGRLLGLTRFRWEGKRAIKFGDTAEVVVVRLFKGTDTSADKRMHTVPDVGTEQVVASTSAFDSQVGAHVQWGQSDEELYFNDIELAQTSARPVGVRLNTTTGKRTMLQCAIYAISPDGNICTSYDRRW
jgi:hypothetical protein